MVNTTFSVKSNFDARILTQSNTETCVTLDVVAEQ